MPTILSLGSSEPQMLARLGEVLYWTACGIGALLGMIGVYAFFNDNRPYSWAPLLICWVVAGLVWLVGRGARYVLAAK